jgi:hypothetical protein
MADVEEATLGVLVEHTAQFIDPAADHSKGHLNSLLKESGGHGFIILHGSPRPESSAAESNSHRKIRRTEAFHPPLALKYFWLARIPRSNAGTG